MRSTVLKYAAALLVSIACATAAAKPPRVLQDPLLGLRYDAHAIRFEAIPNELIAQCPFLAGSGTVKGVWFIYARAIDASGRAFYLLNGYEIRLRPLPPAFPRYETGTYGLLISTTHDQCAVIDADARQFFADRMVDDALPQDVLQRLANDYAARMTRAFGSVDKLGTALGRQRVDFNALPAELQTALREIRPAAR